MSITLSILMASCGRTSQSATSPQTVTSGNYVMVPSLWSAQAFQNEGGVAPSFEVLLLSGGGSDFTLLTADGTQCSVLLEDFDSVDKLALSCRGQSLFGKIPEKVPSCSGISASKLLLSEDVFIKNERTLRFTFLLCPENQVVPVLFQK